MRHVTVTSNTCKSTLRGETICLNVPYDHHYIHQFQKDGFKNAFPRKTYVKIIQYINDHDGCKRKEILRGIGKDDGRGELSTIFSQLLYLDIIDYDKKYNYHLGKNGKSVLRNAYINGLYLS